MTQMRRSVLKIQDSTCQAQSTERKGKVSEKEKARMGLGRYLGSVVYSVSGVWGETWGAR